MQSTQPDEKILFSFCILYVSCKSCKIIVPYTDSDTQIHPLSKSILMCLTWRTHWAWGSRGARGPKWANGGGSGWATSSRDTRYTGVTWKEEVIVSSVYRQMGLVCFVWTGDEGVYVCVCVRQIPTLSHSDNHKIPLVPGAPSNPDRPGDPGPPGKPGSPLGPGIPLAPGTPGKPGGPGSPKPGSPCHKKTQGAKQQIQLQSGRQPFGLCLINRKDSGAAMLRRKRNLIYCTLHWSISNLFNQSICLKKH